MTTLIYFCVHLDMKLKTFSSQSSSNENSKKQNAISNGYNRVNTSLSVLFNNAAVNFSHDPQYKDLLHNCVVQNEPIL